MPSLATADYSQFGNFHYGATGSALGFPDEVFLQMAGWAQQQAGTSGAAWGSPSGRAPMGMTRTIKRRSETASNIRVAIARNSNEK
uniref:polymorphic toxin type 44 domain-containing protein n=1 Tax=Massilia sp. METH4 TaxID=3123041 RepID=UPI00403F1F27